MNNKTGREKMNQEDKIEIIIRENQELNGIEVVFSEKPSQEVIDILKSQGFRWSFKKRLWYYKNAPPGAIENIKKAFGL